MDGEHEVTIGSLRPGNVITFGMTSATKRYAPDTGTSSWLVISTCRKQMELKTTVPGAITVQNMTLLHMETGSIDDVTWNSDAWIILVF